MAKKKKKGPRIMKWVEMGCEGVTKEGRLKKGWGPPAAKGQCPRAGKGAAAVKKGLSTKRTKAIVKGVKECSPLFRKAVGTGFKRGYTACEKALPSDLKAKASAQREDAERAWAASHGIPTLSGVGRRRRRRSR